MSTIKSSNSVDIIVNGATVLTANASGISISGSISGSSISVNNVTSTNPIDSASYASEASHALNADLATNAGFATNANTAASVIVESNPYDFVTYPVFTLSNGANEVLHRNTSFIHDAVNNILYTTASLAQTSSFSFYAQTASLAPNYVLNSATSSFIQNSETSSFATTGSNNFNGNQTITGSLTITQNLTVLGSSSIIYITASQLDVGINTISVNVAEPGMRFGGLIVYDSGSLSHQATASLFWDSQNNKWIYQNASGSTYSGGGLMSGPRNTGSLGEEIFPTLNTILKGQGGDHLTDSNITDNGTLVNINSNTNVTGSLNISGSLLVNGSPVTSGGSFASRFIIHNGEGSTTALTTGIKYTTTVIADKASTITGWKIFCNPSSSATLDVLKANKTKPTAANSITGSAAPSITNNQYAESTTLTGWTTSVAEGDILVLNIVSNTAASYIQLELTQQ